MKLSLLVSVALAELGAVGAFVLLSIAIAENLNGFAWSNDAGAAGVKNKFNYHPFFMLLGFVVIQTQAIISYRTLRRVRKFHVKCFHMTCMILALIFAIVALVAVISATPVTTPTTDSSPYNFYSLHSWIGLAILSVYLCQAAGGIVVLFYPKLSYGIRESFVPYHRFVGATLHVLILAACLTGLMQLSTFASVRQATQYDQYSRFMYTINFAAGALIVNGLGVVSLLLNDDLRRSGDL